MLFIKKSDDDEISWLSLYHLIVSGSSPFVTAHDIWISWPSSTSLGNTNGSMSGPAGKTLNIQEYFEKNIIQTYHYSIKNQLAKDDIKPNTIVHREIF